MPDWQEIRRRRCSSQVKTGPVMDQFARLASADSFDQADGLAGALGRLRVVPAVFLAEDITQGVVVPLIAGWGDVEAAPAGKLQARRQEMQLDAAFMGMAHPKHIMLVRIQSGEGQALEGVHHLTLLQLGRRILGGESEDAGAIGPLVRATVDQCPHPLGIAAQHLGQRFAGEERHLAARVADGVAVLIIGNDLAGNEIVDRAGTATLAIAEKLAQHGSRSPLEENRSSVSASARSMATRRMATSTASMAETVPRAWAVFSQ